MATRASCYSLFILAISYLCERLVTFWVGRFIGLKNGYGSQVSIRIDAAPSRGDLDMERK